MKRGVLGTALALCACAGNVMVGDKPVALEAQTVAPYEFLEQCADLAVGDRLDYRFESKAPVHFEIYYKDGITFVATITRDEVTSDGGIFRAPVARRYCARWEAGREGAIVDLRMRVLRTAAQ